MTLVRGSERIACELSFQTTTDHELANVRKCLREGYSVIAVLCEDRKRLNKLQRHIEKALLPGEAERVRFETPDAFLRFLSERSAIEGARGPKLRKINILSRMSDEERLLRESYYLGEIRKAMAQPSHRA